MFELPEYVTLARQMNHTLQGKTIQRGQMGNSPHKFVWYNRSHDEFERLTKGRQSGVQEQRDDGFSFPSSPGMCCCWENAGARRCTILRGKSAEKVPFIHNLRGWLLFHGDDSDVGSHGTL